MLDLYSLSSSDFNAVISEFPLMQSLLADVAIERLQRLGKYSDEARQNEVKRYEFDINLIIFFKVAFQLSVFIRAWCAQKSLNAFGYY